MQTIDKNQLWLKSLLSKVFTNHKIFTLLNVNRNYSTTILKNQLVTGAFLLRK